MKPPHLIKHYTVTELIDGEKIKVTLPQDKAETLYNKLLKIGADVSMEVAK